MGQLWPKYFVWGIWNRRGQKNYIIKFNHFLISLYVTYRRTENHRGWDCWQTKPHTHTMQILHRILLNQENPPIFKPRKSISFCPSVWADCLYICTDNSHFSAFFWWKKRNTFPIQGQDRDKKGRRQEPDRDKTRTRPGQLGDNLYRLCFNPSKTFIRETFKKIKSVFFLYLLDSLQTSSMCRLSD